MTDSIEQARMRQHLAEMRRAARGLGHDFTLKFRDLEGDIDRFGKATVKDARYLKEDIERDFSELGRAIDEEVRSIPGKIGAAGVAVGVATERAAVAAKDAMVSAGHKAKEGTKSAFARAAGVKRGPMTEWRHPSEGSGSGDGNP